MSKATLSQSFLSLVAEKRRISIGRSTENDIVTDQEDLTVGRKHAELYYEDGQWWVKDLHSKNGVFVDDRMVDGKSPVKPGSTIFICLHSFNLSTGYLDLRKEVAIRAESVEKEYPNGYVGLMKMDIEISSSEFVAVMGPSGCGKSTFLKVLNGDSPATSGKVMIHGLELVKHYNLLKKQIGYVPQEDIIHKDLTVWQTMKFAARLRLPVDIGKKQIKAKISTVLESLFDKSKVQQLYHKPVKSLSGGERKRLSIAVELLTEPSVLFLDEPTSPLDPESIHEFLTKLNNLKKKGTTIVMVTHKPEDLNYVDNVIFLGTGGQHSYFGSKDKILEYFNKKTIIEVYNLLTNKETSRAFYEKLYRAKKNLYPGKPGTKVNNQRKEPLLPRLFWLTARYFRIKLNDKENMLLLLAQPVIIAGLLTFIFKEFQLGVLFLMAISAVWFGVSNAAKEIVTEQAIYKRERMFNLNINVYLFSKLIVLSIIAAIQVFVFVGIIYLKFKHSTLDNFDEVYLRDFAQSFSFVFFLSVSASLLGLLLSAVFKTAEKVMTVVPIALMPQIMLAGVLTRIDNWVIELISYGTLGRWGTEGLGRIQDEAMQKVSEEDGSVIALGPEIITEAFETAPGCQCTSATIDWTSEVPNTKGALNTLDFYNENLIEKGELLGNIMNSMEANIIAIITLNTLLYAAIYFFLKKKDSI